jgi:hypothetical protein
MVVSSITGGEPASLAAAARWRNVGPGDH